MPEPTESTQKKSPLHVFDESMRRSLHKKADPAVTGQSYGGRYHSGKVKNSGSAGGNSRNRWRGRWQDRCNHQKKLCKCARLHNHTCLTESIAICTGYHTWATMS